MEHIETRLAQLEAELTTLKRQNRRIRRALPLAFGLAATPFVMGWTRADNATFDLVRAKQIQIQNGAGKTTVLIGTGSGLSSAQPGGFVYVTDGTGQIVGELDGYSNRGGTLRLMEAGQANSPSNTGLVRLSVSKAGVNGKAFGRIELFPANGARVGVQMLTGLGGPGSISIENGSFGSLIRLAADNEGNGTLSVRDKDGKSEALIEALAPKPTTLSVAPSTGRQKSLPRLGTIATSGGGARLSLKGPDRQVTFAAPQAPKSP